MTEQKKKRRKRNDQPDLEGIASATECTGSLPFQPAEKIPDEVEEKR